MCFFEGHWFIFPFEVSFCPKGDSGLLGLSAQCSVLSHRYTCLPSHFECSWRSMYYAATGILCSQAITKAVLKRHFRKLKPWSNLYLRVPNIILSIFCLCIGQKPTSRRQRKGSTWITTSIWYLESHSLCWFKIIFYNVFPLRRF